MCHFHVWVGGASRICGVGGHEFQMRYVTDFGWADITHESLSIETGAYFEGRMHSLKAASSTGAAKL